MCHLSSYNAIAIAVANPLLAAFCTSPELSKNTALLAGKVQKTSFVPPVKLTAASPLEDEIIVAKVAEINNAYGNDQEGLKSFIKRIEDDMSVDLLSQFSEILRKKYNKIVISPGPGNPNQAGNCLKIVKEVYKKIPILGVCLGHQIIGQVFGGKIIHANNLMHGKTSKIRHIKKGLFKNIQNNFEATRYHSLVVDRKKFPKKLLITAETKNKTIMGLMHKEYDIHGFQFHPESISTKVGMKLIKNFISN